MVNNIIRINDIVYLIRRILSPSATEEEAIRVHQSIGTQSLLRNKDGRWFCCMQTVDVEFTDIEVVSTPKSEDYSHTGFEIGDTGGLG
jgi:hypothetical protein